jgi:hypothetical protein
MAKYAQDNGVTVIPLESTTAAKQWIFEYVGGRNGEGREMK